VHVIRVISGDNDLSALEFQKHYRLPIVHLLDPSRTFGKKYNRGGWPFLMLADQRGRIVYKKNGLVEREEAAIRNLLDRMLDGQPEVEPVTLDGVAYMLATLERTGESKQARRRERFSSLACGPDGKMYVAFTTNRNGNSDVFARAFDGKTWSEDRPVAATAADEYDGMVMIDGQNRVWLSWTSNADGKNYNIFVSTLANLSAPVEPVQITHAEDDAMHGRLASDHKGNVYLTYYKWHKMGQRSRDKEVYLRRWAGGKWSDEVRISPTNVPQYEDHSDPTITGLDEGAVVCWSWDFHRPGGYTGEAEGPTIFARGVDAGLKLGRIMTVSGKQIDVAPALGNCREKRIWCAWDSLGLQNRLRSYRKTLCIGQVASEAGSGRTESFRLSGPVVNVCTPAFAVSPAGAIALLWSETTNGRNWVLRRAELDAKEDNWSKPRAVESRDNPRFCSACYDSAGQLWVSHSIETDNGREIVVRKIEAKDD
jgi:hypothetical protein